MGNISYASIANKNIAAVVGRLFRFKTEQAAIEKLEFIKESFVISAQQEENPPKPCVIMWIKNFEVTENEKKAGRVGNFAFVTYEKMEDGLYTLSATKIDKELKNHPSRKRQKQNCPNWGHPILRSVKKGKIYPSIEEVSAELQNLQMEYPETSIPGQNKLYIMIFSREGGARNPIQKYLLEIKNEQGGGFKIDCKKNDYETRKNTKNSSDNTAGHFTSMVALKRNRKKK